MWGNLSPPHPTNIPRQACNSSNFQFIALFNSFLTIKHVPYGTTEAGLNYWYWRLVVLSVTGGAEEEQGTVVVVG